MLDVMAGFDPEDPITAAGVGHAPPTYTAFLDRNGLRGARIGVLREYFGTDAAHVEVNRVMAQAIAALRARRRAGRGRGDSPDWTSSPPT